MAEKRKGSESQLPASKQAEVEAFLRQVAAMPAVQPASGRGRLIFALDATASREPTWDHACRLQGEMFEATASLGGLDVQLVFYRGFGECKASRRLSRTQDLHAAMRKVSCVGGETQIARVLKHAIDEAKAGRVNALVFVGDAMEEPLEGLLQLAGELALLNVPAFVFHEGDNPVAGRAFKEIARLSRGAYCPFNNASAQQLKELLGAVAVFAAGGRKALADYTRRTGGATLLLTRQMGGA
ncbi:MAG TPA: VWA domain-containing protein [Stellaceae bacterium]|nr:VWA domain-containing protein [Stellaceae bacterium]